MRKIISYALLFISIGLLISSAAELSEGRRSCIELFESSFFSISLLLFISSFLLAFSVWAGTWPGLYRVTVCSTFLFAGTLTLLLILQGIAAAGGFQPRGGWNSHASCFSRTDVCSSGSKLLIRPCCFEPADCTLPGKGPSYSNKDCTRFAVSKTVRCFYCDSCRSAGHDLLRSQARSSLRFFGVGILLAFLLASFHAYALWKGLFPLPGVTVTTTSTRTSIVELT